MAETNNQIAEVAVDNPKVMEALVWGDFELLGTNLKAEYYKGGDGVTHFLLMPTDEAGARGITIQEMVDDISELLGINASEIDISELTNNLTKLNIKPEEIKVILKMAYFYVKYAADKPNETEYAFQLEIDTSAVLPEDFKVFNVYKIGIAVWNTTRPNIISQMNLYKPEDLLRME